MVYPFSFTAIVHVCIPFNSADPNGRTVKLWICGRSLAGIVASNPARGMDISRQEESYRVRCVWVRSWSLDNEEALAPYGLLRHEKYSRQ
jgi:hypothetical protein